MSLIKTKDGSLVEGVLLEQTPSGRIWFAADCIIATNNSDEEINATYSKVDASVIMNNLRYEIQDRQANIKMKTSSRTQINANLVSINFLPSEPTITDMCLFEKEWLISLLDAATLLDTTMSKDMVWELLLELGRKAYENFEIVPFKTKGGIKGYALFPIRHPHANPQYRKVHLLVYPPRKKANSALLYGHAPISSWEGYILENMREDYFFRFLEYDTPHIEVAEILLRFTVSRKS